MSRKMTACAFFNSIHEIDYDGLYEKGIRGIFFDIDNTLEPYSTAVPSEETKALVKDLKEKGFCVGVVSNAKQERTEKFCGEVFPDRVFKAGKPLSKGFTEMADKFGLKPGQTAMVGDQLFTDILGGNLFGAYTILVEPINKDIEPPFVAFKRLLEKPFLRRNHNVAEKN